MSLNSKQFWARQNLVKMLGSLKLGTAEAVWHELAVEWCCPDCDSDFTFIDDCPGHDEDHYRGREYDDESYFE